MKNLAALLIVFVAALIAACDEHGNSTGDSHGFSLTRENIIGNQSKLPGSIYKQVGAQGPYREEGTFVGTDGGSGSVWAGAGSGRITESWPATPGYSYLAFAYSNATNQGFIVIRKVSKEEAERAEAGQPAPNSEPK